MHNVTIQGKGVPVPDLTDPAQLPAQMQGQTLGLKGAIDSVATRVQSVEGWRSATIEGASLYGPFYYMIAVGLTAGVAKTKGATILVEVRGLTKGITATNKSVAGVPLGFTPGVIGSQAGVSEGWDKMRMATGSSHPDGFDFYVKFLEAFTPTANVVHFYNVVLYNPDTSGGWSNMTKTPSDDARADLQAVAAQHHTAPGAPVMLAGATNVGAAVKNDGDGIIKVSI